MDVAAHLVKPTARDRRDYLRWLDAPISRNAILYEEAYGKHATGSPFAIFAHLLKDDRFSDYRHVWSVAADLAVPQALKKVADNPNVTIVRHGSREYLKALSTSEILINDSKFRPYFIKRDNQCYINTLRGVQFDAIGKVEENIRFGPYANSQRNLLIADYVVSTGSAFTERIANSFDLLGVANTRFLEVGNPAQALLPKVNRTKVRKALGLLNTDTMVLYSPAREAKSKVQGSAIADDQLLHVRELHAVMPEGYRLIARLPGNPDIDDNDEVSSCVYTGTLTANQLMAASDMMVTDYSYIAARYVPTGRPVVFYRPDQIIENQNRRGYIPQDQLPGPICITPADVREHLDPNAATLATIEARRNCYNSQWDSLQGENAASLIADTILNRADTLQGRSIANDCPNVLVYPGRLIHNDITATFLNLEKAIDPEHVNLAVVLQTNVDPKNIARLSPNTRVFFHQNVKHFRTSRERMDYFSFITSPESATTFGRQLESFFTRASTRSFGNTGFSTVIDFSGYSRVISAMLSCTKATTHAIWLHKNMADEYQERFPYLRGIFALYPRCSHRVCTNQQTLDENSADLPRVAPPALPPTEVIKPFFDSTGIAPDGTIEATGAFDTDGKFREESPFEGAVRFVKEMPFNPAMTNFINIAAYTDEKNQSALIEAFANVHRDYDDTRLYLVGEGKLHGTLQQQVISLGLQDAVFITGPLNNHLPLLQKSKALILTSLSEEVPSAILEALAMKVPVISTDVSGARNLLEEFGGGSLIEEKSSNEIAEAMRRFLVSGIPTSSTFVTDEYNTQHSVRLTSSWM
ncbi:MAG: CDP-glycerol glycerophosphotransferase family protein [Cellulomonadaceae bacterium]|nr:CDP-glycerol glycerophosphotransferase family protein [Cellulomonadaceae bacterium]